MKKTILLLTVLFVSLSGIVISTPTIVDFSTIDSFIDGARIDRIGDITFSHDLKTYPDGFATYNESTYNYYGEKGQYFTFDHEVLLISLDVNGSLESLPIANTLIFKLYDISGTLVSTKTIDATSGFETIIFNENNVSKVLIDFTGGNLDGPYSYGDDRYHAWYILDNITYIPEPATLLLLGMGAVMMRRRK